MPKVKTAPGAAKKSPVKKSRRLAVKAVVPPKTRARSAKKPALPAPREDTPSVETSTLEAQTRVAASKFARVETDAVAERPAPRGITATLPSSYGESHLLLLVRDPQTLFAAWDMAPGALGALRARLGARAFAVSTLTLRLTRASGGTSVMHLGKKARSRYLKIGGGPSFIAEIGFTSPAGQFDLVARSAPCFVPMGALARKDAQETGRRAVLGYREARAVARRALAQQRSPRLEAASVPRSHSRSTTVNMSADPPATSAPARELGGASDLYRR